MLQMNALREKKEGWITFDLWKDLTSWICRSHIIFVIAKNHVSYTCLSLEHMIKLNNNPVWTCLFIVSVWHTAVKLAQKCYLSDMKIFFWKLVNEAHRIDSTFSVKMKHVSPSTVLCKWKRWMEILCFHSVNIISIIA